MVLSVLGFKFNELNNAKEGEEQHRGKASTCTRWSIMPGVEYRQSHLIFMIAQGIPKETKALLADKEFAQFCTIISSIIVSGKVKFKLKTERQIFFVSYFILEVCKKA